MKSSYLALVVLVLAATILLGIVLEKTLPVVTVQAAGGSANEGAPANQPDPGPEAVPVAKIPLVFQLFVGLICGFFVLLGVVPIFLIDSDNRAA